MDFIILGSGTSQGVPMIGCTCPVCSSTDKKDKRTRCSLYISNKDDNNQTNILIDCGPEFRLQALDAKICSLNTVLLTHSHADHVSGLDDLRVFANTTHIKLNEPPLDIYGNTSTIRDLKLRYKYLFEVTQVGGGKLNCLLHNIEEFNTDNNLIINNIAIVPIPMKHGNLSTTGYLIKSIDSQGKTSPNQKSLAYLTDCNYISDSSMELVKNVNTLIIDGLRDRPHSTHFNFLQALKIAEKINPEKTYLTHITHDICHVELNAYLKELLKHNGIKLNFVEAAYDGLKIKI